CGSGAGTVTARSSTRPGSTITTARVRVGMAARRAAPRPWRPGGRDRARAGAAGPGASARPTSRAVLDQPATHTLLEADPRREVEQALHPDRAGDEVAAAGVGHLAQRQ